MIGLLDSPVKIAGFILILIVLVIVHELGHMVVAKWCGLRVERFSVFFGRPLLSYTRGETQYAVGWLPLGGYVKITGMTRGEEVPPEVEDRAYYNAKTWKKVATISAGPGVNIALAFLLFCAVFWIGVPTAQTVNRVAAVADDSPAAAIGLSEGDRIVAVEGLTVSGVDGLRSQLEARPGQATAVTYETEEGASVTRTVVLDAVEVGGEEVGRLGFSFGIEAGPSERFGFVEGLERGWDFTSFVVEETVRTIGGAFTDAEAREDVATVVGIGAVFTEISDDGFVQILRFTALLSLALGIFNLIPVLPLDGGHIVFALIERVRGKSLSRAVYERASIVGLALLMLVFFVALQNDIVKISGDGFNLDR